MRIVESDSGAVTRGHPWSTGGSVLLLWSELHPKHNRVIGLDCQLSWNPILNHEQSDALHKMQQPLLGTRRLEHSLVLVGLRTSDTPVRARDVVCCVVS